MWDGEYLFYCILSLTNYYCIRVVPIVYKLLLESQYVFILNSTTIILQPIFPAIYEW